jgi:subtilisin family serine protease
MNKFTRSLTLSILLVGLFVVLGSASGKETPTVLNDGPALLEPQPVRGAGVNQLSRMASGVVLLGLKSDVTLTMQGAHIQTGNATLNAALDSLDVQSVESVFPDAQRRVTAAAVGGSADLSHIYRLRLAPNADISRAVQILSAHPAVAYAEPDYLAHIIATPDDPLYAGQWGLTQINAPAAWDVITGTSDVVIAVIDSGLNTSHSDLAGQLWANPGEIAGNSVDDDNNGYADDIHGWNLVDDDADLSDNTGHGTQVAGVIAAATNNSQGVAGVCWNCRLMVVKVTQAGGVANYSDIAAGVAYAAQKGADVINLSLGGYSDSATLKAAIAAASQTAVVVGGAGNDDSSAPFYPAAYDDHVLAVAGTTNSDTKVGTSNYGAWVDVSAPGEAITTTFSGGGYGSTSGTSMAAPFASGLAGLLRSQHSDWSPNMVRAQIVHTTDGIDGVNPGYEGELGSGRIDAGQAVTTAAQPLLQYEGHTVDGEPDGRPEPGSSVELDVTLFNDWADAANVQATLSTTDTYVTIITGTASYGSIMAYGSGTNTTSFHFSVSGSAPYAYDIRFALNVAADGGYAVSIPITVPTSPGVTYVHGTLNTQTWTNDRTYIVDNDAGIAAGETLTIQPGTTVRFAGNYSLSVAGTLIADGAEEQPIRFTSNQANPAAGDWGQIKFLDSSVDAAFDGTGNYTGGSILRYTIIEFGQGANLDNAAPFITHNAFDYDGGGIGGSGSPGLVVAFNEIMHIDDASCGLQLSGGDLSIVGNTVYGGMEGLSISGSGIIAENSVSNVLHWGIIAQGSLTVTANRVMDCDEGIVMDGGFVSGNLLANNDTYGLRINGGTPTVVSNTLAFNGSAGIYIQSGTPVLHHNNLVAGVGPYALRNATANALDATSNWWSTTDDAAIQVAIYDGSDEFGLGVVDYSGYLSGSEQHAPAYLTNLTLTPASPVGIETVAFDLTFSGPMAQSANPQVVFHPFVNYDTTNSGLPNDYVETIAIDFNGTKWFGTGYGGGVAHFDGSTWSQYNSSNSDLPNDDINAITIDGNEIKWFGTGGGAARFDGLEWIVYDTSNSGLPNNNVQAIAIDSDGTMWFATFYGGVAHFDGATWTVYNTSNSSLPDNLVVSIAIDQDGTKWFGVQGGVTRFDGTGWTTYNPSNSGLPSYFVGPVVVDNNGTKWFGTENGAASFDGVTWTVYNTSNSDLPGNSVRAIAVEGNGTKWFGTDNGLARFGATWTVYDTSNSDLPMNHVTAIAIQDDRAKWFGTWGGGASVLYSGQDYVIANNAQWLDATHWRATYDVTSLVPRGTYTISVSGARGATTMMSGTLAFPLPGGGMEIPTDTRFGFTVDYAGEITDQTPPPPPGVIAGGVEGDASIVEAMWWASDPDSSITGYRYAIGSAAGATDIVNWTTTSSNSISRSGLGLVDGQQYWLAVQARNEGGLWSASGYSAFVAGQPFLNHAPYMPGEPIPQDSASDVPVNQTLSWQGGDPDGQPVTYTVALGIINPPSVVATRTDTSYTPSELITDTTYYWVITATDGISTIAGSTWTFTTVTEQPFHKIFLPLVLRNY